jgi:hypothetical protein
VVEVDRRMRAGSLAMNAGNLAELVAAVAPASA